MGKVIITEQMNRLLITVFNETKPVCMETTVMPEQESILGNIYIARVQDVINSIHGAFLFLSDKQSLYLPLSEKDTYLCANRSLKEGELPRQGDELVVQVTGEAIKTKPPKASSELTLTGQFCVCSYFGHGLTFSKKLDADTKAALESEIKAAELPGRKKYKFTIRTNAGNLADYKPVLDEMASFIRIFDELTECYKHRTVYSCLYQTQAELLKVLQNIPLNDYEEIVTDVESVFSLLKKEAVEIKGAFPESKVLPATQCREEYRYRDKLLRFYRDELISLSKLYSIETHLAEALSKKVWLSCGGYLIIEPTEAMTVIDVNSGKTEGRDKKNDAYFLKVNMEAAKEIARQLRLRNYSGIIMVDFINLDSSADKKKLMSYLNECLKEDKVPTRAVDMTALGIVEITRKKTNKPLADYFK